MREFILLYLDKCRVRRLIRFQGLSAVPLAVALVVWFILYAVYRKGAAPLERRLNAMEQEDVVS